MFSKFLNYRQKGIPRNGRRRNSEVSTGGIKISTYAPASLYIRIAEYLEFPFFEGLDGHFDEQHLSDDSLYQLFFNTKTSPWRG